MTVDVRARAVVTVVLAAACSAVGAQSNLLFLKSSPVSRFNDDDVKLMLEAGRAVLDSDEPSATRSWRNERTRHSGRVALVRRFEFDGRDCRRLRVDNTAGGMQGTTQLSACRDAAGAWTIEPRARPPAAKR